MLLFQMRKDYAKMLFLEKMQLAMGSKYDAINCFSVLVYTTSKTKAILQIKMLQPNKFSSTELFKLAKASGFCNFKVTSKNYSLVMNINFGEMPDKEKATDFHSKIRLD